MGRYKGTRELSFLKEGYEEDFEDETRLARRQKRKSVAEGKSERNSLMNATKRRRNDSTQVREEMLDKDYEEFLEYLAEHGDEGQDYLDTGCMDDGKAHSDEELMDPEYKIFLENLRHDGKACVLEVLQENGKMVMIKYELEEGILEGPNLDTPATLKESQVKEKTEIERNLRRGRTFGLNNPVLPSREEDIETPRTLRYAMKKQNRRNAEASEDLPKKKSSLVKKSERLEAADPVSDWPSGRSNKMRRLEVPNTPDTFTNSPDLPKKKSSEVKKNVKVEAPDPVSDRPNGRSNKMHRFEVLSTPIYSPDLPKKKSSEVKKNAKVEAPEPVSNTLNGHSNKTEIKKTSGRFMKKEKIKVGRPKKSAHLLNKKVTESLRSPKYVIKENNWETQEYIPEKKSVMMKKHANEKVADYYPKGRPIKRTHFSECGCNHRAESDLLDDDYKMFLNGLNKVGGKKVYRSRSHDVVILEEDEESSSDVEIQEESSHRHFTSFTAVNRDSRRCIETDDTSHAQYRKELMKDLKRPYDEQEYKKLLKEVSRRRLMGHARNLRHTIKCYSVAGELAPSYRERFVVLSRKIDQAKDDRPRILVLLRGFFYWLKTLAQEGSFTPWSDPECLKVLPQPDKKRKFNHNHR